MRSLKLATFAGKFSEDPLRDCARAWAEPLVSGEIRARPEHFRVTEALRFSPDGEGEHALVKISKRGHNTLWVAKTLAAFAGVPVRDVGFAGLKDRRAVAEQWFSIRLANRPDPDWNALSVPGLQVCQVDRHRRKLRRDAVAANRFDIKVCRLEGDIDTLEPRLQHIRTEGVPNYFGPQRFGRNASNLENAWRACDSGRWPRGLAYRGLLLSAARAFLFNAVLSQRVSERSWNGLRPGDLAGLDGSRSHFLVERLEPDLHQRVWEMDIHPTGPLWGLGDHGPAADVQAMEQDIAAKYAVLASGLERAGVKAARRVLRVVPEGLHWDTERDNLHLSLSLPAGSFATSVLREMIVS